MEYANFAQVNGGLNDVSSVFCDLQMKALTKLHMGGPQGRWKHRRRGHNEGEGRL